MPFAIVKQSCLFLEDEYVENPVTHETTQVIISQLTVYPNPDNTPQELPDWVSYDELYDLGVKEGWIIEVTEQSARVAQEQAAKKKTAAGDKQEKVPAGLQSVATGWKK